MNFFKTNIDKAKYRDSLIKKLHKRRNVLIVQHNRYRNNECVQLLGIETTMWIDPNTYCTINAATSNAEIIRKTKRVTAYARLLKAYTNLAEMNVSRANHPRDQALSSFTTGLVIASGPLVHSMLNSLPFYYPRKRLFTLNDMAAFTKVLVDAHEFCQHPEQLSASKQLERSFARFKRNMNKVLLLNYITLTKLRALFTPIYPLLVAAPIADSLYAVVCVSLIMGMLPHIAFAIAIIAASLSAMLITGLVLTISHLKACRAENQSIKEQATVIQDVKNQFGKLTKEHGLFKVKKHLEVEQVAPIAASTLRNSPC